jgi:hypothetical protein
MTHEEEIEIFINDDNPVKCTYDFKVIDNDVVIIAARIKNPDTKKIIDLYSPQYKFLLFKEIEVDLKADAEKIINEEVRISFLAKMAGANYVPRYA